MNTIAKFRQYGIKNSIIRVIKYALRMVGIKYEEYIYCKQLIPDLSQFTLNLPASLYLKDLTLQDYLNSSLIPFESYKIELFKKRFKSGNYFAYGIFDNEKLVYSCWISLKVLEMPGTTDSMSLDVNEGLLVDAICHPDYRSLGIHSQMNIYRLKQVQNAGKTYAVVVLQKENIPARKSQKKAGFIGNELIKVLEIGSRVSIKRYKSKINLA